MSIILVNYIRGICRRKPRDHSLNQRGIKQTMGVRVGKYFEAIVMLATLSIQSTLDEFATILLRPPSPILGPLI